MQQPYPHPNMPPHQMPQAPPQQMPQAPAPVQMPPTPGQAAPGAGYQMPVQLPAPPAGQGHQFAFQANAQAHDAAQKSARGLTGFNMPLMKIPAPQDADSGVDFAFVILPDYEAVQAGDPGVGNPTLRTSIYKGFGGGSKCFYSPSAVFPGSSSPVCSVDLLDQAVDQTFQAQGYPNRFVKNLDLKAVGKEDLGNWRTSMSPRDVTMVQVWEFDPHTLQPLYEADGSPKVSLWVPSTKKWREEFLPPWDHMCALDLAPCNLYHTLIFRGQRRGKEMRDTTYKYTGFYGAGGAQQPGPVASQEHIQAALAKVQPWTSVLHVPTMEDQQQYVASLPYVDSQQAAVGVGQPYAPQAAQPVSPGASIPQIGQPQVGAPAFPQSMPAPAPDATPAQPGAVPAAPHQPPQMPPQMPQAPAAPPQPPQMPPQMPQAPAAPPPPQAPAAPPVAPQAPQAPVTPPMPSGYPGPAGAPQQPGFAPPPGPAPVPPMQ